MARKKIDVCLIADRSSSLLEYKDHINSAMVKMLHSLKNAPELSGLEICFSLTSFASDMTKDVVFKPLDQITDSQMHLDFSGQTNPAPALHYAVNTAYKRYREWVDNDEEAFHPLIFFFTDGNPYPEDNQENYDKVAAQIKSLADNEKILLVSCGFGKAKVDNLKKLAGPKYVAYIKQDNIKDVEAFFSEIIKQTTVIVSTKGNKQVQDILVRFQADVTD